MTTAFINGNSRLLVDHANSSYCLQHPKGGGHQDWQDSLVAPSPEEFLKLYLNRNLNRISAQPKRVAENVAVILEALCSA